MIIEENLNIDEDIKSLEDIAPNRRCYPKLCRDENKVQVLKLKTQIRRTRKDQSEIGENQFCAL